MIIYVYRCLISVSTQVLPGPESAGMDFPRVNYWAALWQQKSHEAIASTDVSPYQRIMLGFFRWG